MCVRLHYHFLLFSLIEGKVMGGTSVLHGNMYMRGNKEDYAEITALGIKGWSWEEVLPYFKKSEDNLNVAEDSIDSTENQVDLLFCDVGIINYAES